MMSVVSKSESNARLTLLVGVGLYMLLRAETGVGLAEHAVCSTSTQLDTDLESRRRLRAQLEITS